MDVIPGAEEVKRNIKDIKHWDSTSLLILTLKALH